MGYDMPDEIIQKIKEYTPKDRSLKSPTATCIRVALYKYTEHKHWNYHAWLLSFQEFVLSDLIRTSPYYFQYLVEYIPAPNERLEW